MVCLLLMCAQFLLSPERIKLKFTYGDRRVILSVEDLIIAIQRHPTYVVEAVKGSGHDEGDRDKLAIRILSKQNSSANRQVAAIQVMPKYTPNLIIWSDYCQFI